MAKHVLCLPPCHPVSFRSLSEALRKDPHSSDFLESLEDILPALAPVFDRAPKYAWIAKQLLEPERAIQFRVVSLSIVLFEIPRGRMSKWCYDEYSIGRAKQRAPLGWGCAPGLRK